AAVVTQLAYPISCLRFYKYGRKKALSLSILLMGIPTILMGIMPGYETIGLLASGVILVCRLLQGLCTGGEYNGAAIFSIEHLGKKFPGFIGGWIAGSCALGAFFATFLGSLTQRPEMPGWAWRIPFLIGGAISFFGYFIRRNATETPEFLEAQKTPTAKTPLLKVFSSNPKSCLIAFGLGGFNGALSYTLLSFLTVYLSRYLKIPMIQSMQLNLIGMLAFMAGSPLMGYLFDKIGHKRFYQGVSLAIFCLAIPIFKAISSLSTLLIIIGELLLGLATASIAGSGHAFMQSLFPVSDRYRGISFNFSVGMAIFGGMTPIIFVNMIEKNQASLLFP
ncbi:MAG: MFS transporter, partial [Chlamydiota bacterium]